MIPLHNLGLIWNSGKGAKQFMNGLLEFQLTNQFLRGHAVMSGDQLDDALECPQSHRGVIWYRDMEFPSLLCGEADV